MAHLKIDEETFRAIPSEALSILGDLKGGVQHGAKGPVQLWSLLPLP